MGEFLCFLLVLVLIMSGRYICIFISIIFGDKSVCHEFVDSCVPIREQITSNFIKPPQDTLDDKGHETGTSANPSDVASQNLDWRQSSQFRR